MLLLAESGTSQTFGGAFWGLTGSSVGGSISGSYIGQSENINFDPVATTSYRENGWHTIPTNSESLYASTYNDILTWGTAGGAAATVGVIALAPTLPAIGPALATLWGSGTASLTISGSTIIGGTATVVGGGIALQQAITDQMIQSFPVVRTYDPIHLNYNYGQATYHVSNPPSVYP